MSTARPACCWSCCDENRGGSLTLPLHDPRHRRAGSCVRPPGVAREARRGPSLCARARSANRDDRARVQSAGRGRGIRRARPQTRRRALVRAGGGAEWRTREELGLRYRQSDLRHGDVVAKVEFRLTARPVDEIKTTVAAMQARRKAAQPTNKRTYGSVFKNPAHELSAGRLLEACGLKGHRIGGAQISPRHANFIENAGGARSADAIALMAEARRRAVEQFGVQLEHEVEFLGPLELPPLR